ncbi:MAG: carboxymuconolactone decarboxylase family protein [Gammaproteobacteria bacterium]|jgi:AhpD family alkylhydroperoxidase
MTKKYENITQELSKYLTKLRQEMPEITQGFSQMSQNATKDGVLSTKIKELITLGIAIANRCEGCIGFHTKKLIKLGATREEIIETLGVAMFMGGGPSYMYAAEALQAFEEFGS